MPFENPNGENETWISSPEYIDYTASKVVDWWGHPASGKFVDIGCSRGGITLGIARMLPPAVVVEGVDSSEAVVGADPSGRVKFVERDGIDYLREQPADSYDGILLKQVLHCLTADRQSQLFGEMGRTLKTTGKILLLGMPEPSRIQMPLFRAAIERYDEEYQNADSILLLAKEFGFRASASEFCFPVRVMKEDYFSMLRGRFLSSLRDLTDGEIESGIAELAEKYPAEEIAFDDQLYAIQLMRAR